MTASPTRLLTASTEDWIPSPKTARERLDAPMTSLTTTTNRLATKIPRSTRRMLAFRPVGRSLLAMAKVLRAAPVCQRRARAARAAAAPCAEIIRQIS
jgi:hypothetical protein